jgi:HAD superfamily hydrolase (TIGR01509 family)
VARAVFFDLDGTLTDYGRMVSYALETLSVKVAGRTGVAAARFVEVYAATQHEDEEAQRTGKLTMTELRDRGRRFGRTLERLGVADPALTHELATAYAEARRTTAFAVPGARETLVRLNERGVWVAIVTEGSSREQRGQLSQLGWTGLVNDVVVSEDVGAHKPDSALARAALTHAGVVPQNAVFVGDRAIWDLKPARELGMTTILYATPLYREEAVQGRAFVDATVDSHQTLLCWLEAWLDRKLTG